jgi:hypothetical protein
MICPFKGRPAKTGEVGRKRIEGLRDCLSGVAERKDWRQVNVEYL